MARLVLIAMLFTFMFIQLASSQDTPNQACIDASLALAAATQCQDADDLSTLCSSGCRDLYNAVFNNCPIDAVSYNI